MRLHTITECSSALKKFEGSFGNFVEQQVKISHLLMCVNEFVNFLLWGRTVFAHRALCSQCEHFGQNVPIGHLVVMLIGLDFQKKYRAGIHRNET